jgi:hypothetical protein
MNVQVRFMFLLGIILRVLRHEVSVWISSTTGKGIWFSIRFSSFLLYNVQKLKSRNCKKLREFEKIDLKAKL